MAITWSNIDSNTCLRVIKLSANKFYDCFNRKVGDYSAGAFTWGSVQSAPSGFTDAGAVIALSDGRILVCGSYTADYLSTIANCWIGTVTGTTISWASATAFPVANAGMDGALLSDGRVLVWGGDNNAVARLGTISGTTITWVSTGASPSKGANAAYPLLLGDGRLLCLSDNVQGGHQQLHFITVSGNSITSDVWLDSPLSSNNTASFASLCLTSTGTVFFGHGADYTGAVQNSTWIGTISGDTISWVADTATTFASNYVSASACLLSDNKIAVFSNNGEGTFSGALVTGSTFNDSVSEPATATHSNNFAFTANGSQSDPATASHTNNAAYLGLVSQSDAATAAHTNSSALALAANQTDAATAAHTNNGLQISLNTLTESNTADSTQSSLKLQLATISEAATAASTQSAVFVVSVTQTDVGTAAELSTGGLLTTVAISEPTTAANTQNAVQIAPAAVSESATAADAMSGGQLIVSSLSEPNTSAETSNGQVFLNGASTEAATASNTCSAIALFLSQLSEAATAAHTNNSIQISLNVQSEAAAALDNPNGTIVFLSTQIDSATASDLVNGGFPYFDSVTDTLVPTASQTGSTKSTSVAMIESGLLQDAVQCNGLFFATVVEMSSATAQSVATMLFSMGAIDAATLSDLVNGSVQLAWVMDHDTSAIYLFEDGIVLTTVLLESQQTVVTQQLSDVFVFTNYDLDVDQLS